MTVKHYLFNILFFPILYEITIIIKIKQINFKSRRNIVVYICILLEIVLDLLNNLLYLLINIHNIYYTNR